LSLSGGITQVSDNGGEEKTEGVDRQAHCVESETVEPDLWVLECLNDASPGKFLLSSSVATVFLESRYDVLPLLGCKELGGGGVVVDKEVCENGDDDGQKALLERHVSRRVESRNRGIYDDEDPPPATQTGNTVHFSDTKGLQRVEL